MIKWIKKNWKDPVWSQVFAWVITIILTMIGSGLWIIIKTLYKSIPLRESLSEFLRFINLKVSIPLWVLILVVIICIVRLIKKYLKGIITNIIKKILYFFKSMINSNSIPVIESKNIGYADHNYNSKLNSNFLGFDYGIFSIWGYVSDIHNMIHPKRRNMYLVGYATNGGKQLNNPDLADYPNAWAIQRITPISTDNSGIWRFWCNNINKDKVHLDFKKPLSGGWHLFSVAWSSEENYIKFIIDNDIVGKERFSNWPTDFSGNVMIGAWPNRSELHFFDSKVGPYKFIKSKYDEKFINEYFKTKPE